MTNNSEKKERVEKKRDPIERVKEIPTILEGSIKPTISNVREAKNNITLALEKLNQRKNDIKMKKQEEATALVKSESMENTPSLSSDAQVQSENQGTIPEVKPKTKKVKEKDVEVVIQPIQSQTQTEIKLTSVVEEVNGAKPVLEKIDIIAQSVIEKTDKIITDEKSNNSETSIQPEKIDSAVKVEKVVTKTYIPDSSRQDNQNRQNYQPRNNQGVNPNYKGNNPNPNYQNNNPNYQNNNQSNYQGNRPNNFPGGTSPNYKGNNPNPNYQGNRPNNTVGVSPNYQGNRPNNFPGGTSPNYKGNNPNPNYQGNRPNNGGFNNGGYNNGGFNNGGFNNRPNNPLPRLPKGDVPLPVNTKEAPKKKKITSSKDEPKKQLNKRTLVRKGYIESDGEVDENGVIKHVKMRKMKRQSDFTPNTVKIETAIISVIPVSIKILADRIGKTSVQIVKKLFEIGQVVSINDSIDFDTADLIAGEFGIPLEYRPEKKAEDILNDVVTGREKEGVLVKRPPVVTIMGHVDHGKTSLLDYIRKSRVASSEAGGITQHIGAYTIEVNGEPITFLDTPGHEAFTSMRKRGAKVTDIAIVVVAADDGIMPQSIEALNHAKEAGVSVMVAVNKMDKATANYDKTIQQLSMQGIVPEEWGGDTIIVPVSAKTGEGVDNLLENILLLAEVKELKAVADCRAQGSVIEARLDKGTGPVATVLVQNGTLKVGDYVVAGTAIGKIRAMIDDKGKRVKEASPSFAVSVLGFNEVPNAGDQLIVVKDEKLAKQVSDERATKEREEMSQTSSRKNLEDMFKGVSESERKLLTVIIKGDVQGSVEAVKQALLKLNEDMNDKNVYITVLHSGVGAINESDIMLADTANSIIVAFNVRPEPKAQALADRSGVDIKTYRVIYDAIDDVTKAMKGMLDPIFREEQLGHAEVRVVYNITNVGTIAGCYVTDGKVIRNAKFRLIRDNIVIFDGAISSLKRMKDEAKEVASGYECGIGLQGHDDIKVGDIIEAFLLKEEEVK